MGSRPTFLPWQVVLDELATDGHATPLTELLGHGNPPHQVIITHEPLSDYVITRRLLSTDQSFARSLGTTAPKPPL